MNKRIVPLIIFLSILITSVLIFSFTGIVSGKGNESISDEKIDLEDAIIIRELKMSSDNGTREDSDDDYNTDGKIFFDDEFHNSVKSKNGDSREPELSGMKSPILDNLKKKNPRWHMSDYKIKKSDNLWKIAKKFGVSHTLIIETNNINHPDMLLPGISIKVPNKIGIYYTVKNGDTMKKISASHKIDAGKIYAVNNIGEKSIKTGDRIFIPGVFQQQNRPGPALKGVEPQTNKPGAISFIWPLMGKLTSGFGVRKDPFSNQSQFHNGIDISADIGKKIKAAAGGKVIFSGWKVGYGNMVILKHDQGYITVYAHNSKNLVNENSIVKKGDVIALTGMTGAVTGAHLHFELRKYITPLNPLRLLK